MNQVINIDYSSKDLGVNGFYTFRSTPNVGIIVNTLKKLIDKVNTTYRIKHLPVNLQLMAMDLSKNKEVIIRFNNNTSVSVKVVNTTKSQLIVEGK